MRIARYSAAGEVSFGVVEGQVGDGPPGPGLEIAAIAGHPFAPFAFTGDRHRLGDVRLLAPVLPSKVVCIGKNYADHAREMGGEAPASPVMFLKPSTSVVGPGDAIARPAAAERDNMGQLWETGDLTL